MVLPMAHMYFQMIKAFKADCDVLIENFKKLDTHDFSKDFVPLWKLLKFNLIYEKYNRQGIHIDFKEDSLQIAKNIMLKDHFEGGLYLMYGLHFIQDEPKPFIRLEKKELEQILGYMKLKNKEPLLSYKIAVIFAKMIKSDAFACIRFSREFSMEGQQRARLIHGRQGSFIMDEEKEVLPQNWLTGFLKRHNLSEKIMVAERESIKGRRRIKEKYPELNLQLDIDDNEDIITLLMKTLTSTNMPGVMPKKPEDPEVLPEQPSSDDIGETRKRLKTRKIKIKHRYSKQSDHSDDSEDVEDPVDETPPPSTSQKKKGCPRGERKRYLNKIVNEPEPEK